MDPEEFGARVAEKVGEERDEAEEMGPEDKMAHRVAAMAAFSDAHSRHDHEGMAHALEAHDALLDESDKAEGVSAEGEAQEE